MVGDYLYFTNNGFSGIRVPLLMEPLLSSFYPFYLLLTIQKCFYFISWDLLWLAAHFEAYFNLKVFKYKISQMIKSVNKSLIMICKVRDFRKTHIKIINGANVKGFVAFFPLHPISTPLMVTSNYAQQKMYCGFALFLHWNWFQHKLYTVWFH